MKGIQDTTSESLRKLLGNGLRYQVPRFQRDYSWDKEQWDDLWQDLTSLMNGEEVAHYMGYLVLQTDDSKCFKVIDGQQRLTTLSILILAVLKRLQSIIDAGQEVEESQKRQDSLRSSYIGSLDPVTLISSNKLSLNRNNDEYYRDYLVPLGHLPVRNVDASSALMRKCFEWFVAKLKVQCANGKELAQFVDVMVDKLFFTVITVNTELNAFVVFETLNSRGVQLSSADLLKNYLFSVVDKANGTTQEISEVERLWAKVLAKLKNQRFPEFLRVFWNSRNPTTRKNDLFKVLRREVVSKAQVFELLRELNEDADIYMALRSPEDELWQGGSDFIRKRLAELKMFNVQQPLPLLLGAYHVLGRKDFERLLRACVTVSVRYNVIGGLNPNDQETTYNAIVLRIRSEKQFQQEWMQPVYPADQNFEVDFSNKILRDTSRNRRVVKYLLAAIEQKAFGHVVEWESEALSVEHILPEHPDDDSWGHVDDDEFRRSVYRVGNLTLLESKLNKRLGNAEFSEKLGVFQKSEVQSTKAIAEHYSTWNEETIASRQKRMAKTATEIWKFT